jgi:membrane-associated phospholipid phosphatase
MRLAQEHTYTLAMLSALGAYPLHILFLIISLKLERFDVAIFLFAGFVGLYVFGTVLRLTCFQTRTHPHSHVPSTRFPRASSFPSYHVARLTFYTGALWYIFPFEWDIALLFICITCIVARERVVRGHHYVSDVVGGIALGTVLVLLSYMVL